MTDNYCHENLFAKYCNTYIILHCKKKLKRLFLFLVLSYFLSDIKILNYGDHSSIAIFWMKFPLCLEER